MHFTLCAGTSLERPFEFSIPEGTEGLQVFVSGGLDSLTLLSLLTTVAPGLPLVALTVKKADGAPRYAERIVNRLTASTGVGIVHRSNIENDPGAYEQGRVGWSVIEAVNSRLPPRYKLYGGMNKMAPGNIRPFTQRMNASYDELITKIEMPFLDLHTPQIVDLLKQLGGLYLAEYTRSCTVNDVGECGECYSCKEREWGFEFNGLPVIRTLAA